MNLFPVTREDATQMLRQAYGLGDLPLSRGDYAQLIRRAVLERGSLSRSQLVRGIHAEQELLGLEEEVTTSVLDELLRRGDLTLGKRANVYAAPCRIIRSRDNGGIIVGTLTREHLSSFPGTLEEDGAARVYTTTRPDDVQRWLDQIRGREIQPAAWTGVERAPQADQALLAQQNLGRTSLIPVAQARVFCVQTKAWRKTSEPQDGLWRILAGPFANEYFYGRPDGARSISYDMAIRLQHALARGSCPYVATFLVEEVAVRVPFPTRLPTAEYRHLSLHARAQDNRTFVFHKAEWPVLRTFLEQRLGIQFEEVQT